MWIMFNTCYTYSYGVQKEVAKEFGVPVQFQRFWIWAKRQNHTYRPNRPLTAQEETQSVYDDVAFTSIVTLKYTFLYPINEKHVEV